MDFVFDDGEEKYEIRVMKNTDDSYTVTIGEEQYTISGQLAAADTLFLRYSNQTYRCIVAKEGDMRYIYYNGNAFKLQRIEKAALDGVDAISQENRIKSPMPGKVLKIHVKVGDSVTKGQHLMILEAMKMENAIPSAEAGTVKEIKVNVNDKVATNQVLMVLE